jgi:hypothetical protein
MCCTHHLQGEFEGSEARFCSVCIHLHTHLDWAECSFISSPATLLNHMSTSHWITPCSPAPYSHQGIWISSPFCITFAQKMGTAVYAEVLKNLQNPVYMNSRSLSYTDREFWEPEDKITLLLKNDWVGCSACCLFLARFLLVSCLANSSTLKMETVHSIQNISGLTLGLHCLHPRRDYTS